MLLFIIQTFIKLCLYVVFTSTLIRVLKCDSSYYRYMFINVIYKLSGGPNCMGRQRSDISCEDGLRIKRVSKSISCLSVTLIY